MHARILSLLSLAGLALISCSGGGGGDESAPFEGDVLGQGRSLASINRPVNEDGSDNPRPGPSDVLDVTGVRVTWVDQYDETRDGRSVGNIFLQDFTRWLSMVVKVTGVTLAGDLRQNGGHRVSLEMNAGAGELNPTISDALFDLEALIERVRQERGLKADGGRPAHDEPRGDRVARVRIPARAAHGRRRRVRGLTAGVDRARGAGRRRWRRAVGAW